MKKTLTKAMAIILSLVMIAAAAPTAFAAYDEIELDKINTVYIETGHEEVVVTFTPQESGYYVITSDNGEDAYDIDPFISVYNRDNYEIGYDDDGGTGYNFACIFEAEAGKIYYIGLNAYDNDVEYDYVISKYIDIVHQPTSKKPYVEISWNSDAEYQWYYIEVGEEITDENAYPVYSYEGRPSSYDPEEGWVSNHWDDYDAAFFEVELNEGDMITVDFGEPVYNGIGIWDYELNEGVYFEDGTESGFISITAPWDGVFELYAHDISSDTTVRA